MARYQLDVTGQLCPMPVIKMQEKIITLQKGDELLVICTDPGCLEDIPAWCRIHGHRVEEIVEEKNLIKILVEVRGT